MLLLRPMLASVLLLVAAPPATSESLPELLKPVDPAVAAKLMARTNFDFRKQRYAAKRFRIVEIDWALLSQEGARFTITPFPEPLFADLAATVQTQNTARDIQGEGQMREWVGEIENSATLEYSLNGEPIESTNDPFSLWITSGPQEVSLQAAREVAAETGDTARPGMLPTRSDLPGAPRVITRLNLRTVSGLWYVGAERIMLEPIRDDPRYHFVYWFDRDKVPMGSHGEDPEMLRKTRERNDFDQQLEKERREAAPKNAD